MISIHCHACQKPIELLEKILFREECPHCFADLHVCKQCAFFDESRSRQCREDSAEPPRDKEKRNYCDFFEVRSSGALATGGSEPSREDLLAKAEALFKNLKKDD